jgi:hypothetical protein
MGMALLQHIILLCAAKTSTALVLNTLKSATVLNPATGAATPLLDGLATSRNVVILLPQVGEFDSYEFCEQLVAVADDLKAAGLGLRVIGVGNADAGKRFEAFVGLPEGVLRVDPEASVHRELGLHRGLGWSWPDWVSDDALRFILGTLPGGAPDDEVQLRPVGDAWLNYLLMCAGIGAPGTLPEIARGYFGDESAPERLAPDAVVRVGSVIEVGPGVGPVKLGPFRYENSWKDESGYQRPVELATVRLRCMVEVLSNWDAYVSDLRYVDVRGATYVVDGEEILYEYKHRGVLTYSATMSRPLSFLAPFIGARALNPLGLGDNGVARV